MSVEQRRQCHSVLQGLIGALPEVRRHGMGGIADQGDAATNEGVEVGQLEQVVVQYRLR